MMTRFRTGLLAFVMFVASAAGLSAQQTGTITGRLTDAETQTGISGATVQVVTAGNRSVGNGVTDAQGQFRIANVPVGNYALMFDMVGYEQGRIEGVRVVAGETTIAGAALRTMAFQLNPLVVSASKKPEKAVEAPARVEVVQEREIEERPTTTPVEHLRSTPGIDVITAGVQSTNVVARGFNNIFSGALHTLTDYRAARIPSLHVNFLHFVPQTNDDMARMEVVLGPGAALYGPNTANGVLHILTKSPLDDPGSTFAFATGERSLMHITGRTSQLLSPNFGIKVSGQYLQADEWEYQDTVEVAARRLATNNFTQFAAQQPFNPATGQPYPAAVLQQRAALVGLRDFDTKRWSGDVRADWRASENLTFVGSGGMTTATGIELTGIGAGQTQDWRYSYGQLRGNYRNWFAQTYINMSDAGDTYLLRTGAPIVDKSKLWATQLQHSAALGTLVDFTYGADYIRTMPETESTINGRNEDDDTYDEFGAYLQGTLRPASFLDLVGAIRYDKHSHLDDAVFSPRAAAVFHPSDEHSFRVTYNQAFSTPTSLNLFLDIDAGPLGALGPFGYRAHAFAPGPDGIVFRDANGNLGVSAPFNSLPTTLSAAQAAGDPRTFQPITNANIYNLQVSALLAASAARGTPIPTNIAGALRSFAADPALQAIALNALDPVANVRSTFDVASFGNVPGIEESTTKTFEVGYKGIIAERLLLAADAWWSKQENFTSPLITATPLILLRPEALAPFVIQRLMAVGVPQANATAIAQSLVQLPGGVVSAPAAQGSVPELLLTYVNFGEININGMDFSATALLSDSWQVGGTFSWVSDDHFKIPLAGDTQVVALNAPTKKGSAHLTYRNLVKGLNGEVRVRFNDEFPANSAGFVGLDCITGDAATGPCVESYTLLDLTAGYRLPIAGATLQLNITNLFDEKYQSFVGTPEIGRMAIIRLKYDM
ncbi:MAG TPA: TonB-dependent receptor [Longimicrobiales bacterium]